MKKFFTHPVTKIILSALIIFVFGFFLFTIIISLKYMCQPYVIYLFVTPDIAENLPWLPKLMDIIFVVIIGLISWWIFRSKLPLIYKAIYTSVAVGVTLEVVGMFLYRWPIVSYSVSTIITLGILYYLFRTRKPWHYYFAVIMMSIILNV